MPSVFTRCPQCGTVNPRINNFCGNCGIPLVDNHGSDVAAPLLAPPQVAAPAAPKVEEEKLPPPSQPTRAERTVIAPPPMIERPRFSMERSPAPGPEPFEPSIVA